MRLNICNRMFSGNLLTGSSEFSTTPVLWQNTSQRCTLSVLPSWSDMLHYVKRLLFIRASTKNIPSAENLFANLMDVITESLKISVHGCHYRRVLGVSKREVNKLRTTSLVRRTDSVPKSRLRLFGNYQFSEVDI